MADFKLAYFKTMGHEGGYVNNKNDRGGETYKGVARKKNPDWKGWALIDSYKTNKEFIKMLERDEFLQQLVLAFYKTLYWDALQLDVFKSQPIAEELFDTSVNIGTGTAIMLMQEALNLLNRNQKDFHDIEVDGIIGPRTIALLQGYPNSGAMLKTLNGLQFSRYRYICKNNPTQEEFFHGWLNRV